MTVTDKPRFLVAFNRLAVATRLNAADTDGSMHRIYFDGMEDLSIDAVETAASGLAKSTEWFPKVAEWRSAAFLAERVTRLKALPAPREEPWKHECETCDDTGWEYKRCYPGSSVTCGRKGCESERPEHSYTVRCACQPTNRTIQRQKAAMYGAASA